MLVDQLRLTITAQQNAEIVEPRDHALQLYAVDQENGHRDLGFANLVEKCVLQVLSIACHLNKPLFLLAPRAGALSLGVSMSCTRRSFQPKNQIVGPVVGPARSRLGSIPPQTGVEERDDGQ